MGEPSESEDSVAVVSGVDAVLSDIDSGKTKHFAHSMKTLFASISNYIQRLTVQQLSKAPKMPWECGPLMPAFGGKPENYTKRFGQSFIGVRDHAPFAVRPDPSVAPPAWVSKFAAKRQRIVATADADHCFS